MVFHRHTLANQDINTKTIVTATPNIAVDTQDSNPTAMPSTTLHRPFRAKVVAKDTRTAPPPDMNRSLVSMSLVGRSHGT